MARKVSDRALQKLVVVGREPSVVRLFNHEYLSEAAKAYSNMTSGRRYLYRTGTAQQMVEDLCLLSVECDFPLYVPATLEDAKKIETFLEQFAPEYLVEAKRLALFYQT